MRICENGRIPACIVNATRCHFLPANASSFNRMILMTLLKLVQSARAGTVIRIGLAIMTLGCASYRGTSVMADPGAEAHAGRWWMVPSFPLVRQDKSNDCGAAALAAVMRYWGYSATPASIEAEIGRDGNRLRAGDMAAYARTKGLHSYVCFGTVTDVLYEIRRGRPVIVGLGKPFAEKKALSHYQVVVGYEPEKKQGYSKFRFGCTVAAHNQKGDCGSAPSGEYKSAQRICVSAAAPMPRGTALTGCQTSGSRTIDASGSEPRLPLATTQKPSKAGCCKRLLNETAPGAVAQRSGSVDVD
jgi:hypothetical protein